MKIFLITVGAAAILSASILVVFNVTLIMMNKPPFFDMKTFVTIAAAFCGAGLYGARQRPPSIAIAIAVVTVFNYLQWKGIHS
jgi:hypothetical protein